MTGTVPMMPFGIYPVTVTIPESCSATLKDAITVSSSTAMMTSVLPTQGWNGIDNPVIVFGSGFVTGDQLVVVGAATGGGNLDLTNEAVDITGTRIDAFVPQGGMEGGPYDIELQTANGCRALLPQAFTILGQPSLTVDDVIPPYGWTGTKTPVSIRGTQFQSTPKAYLNPDARSEVGPAEEHGVRERHVADVRGFCGFARGWTVRCRGHQSRWWWWAQARRVPRDDASTSND